MDNIGQFGIGNHLITFLMFACRKNDSLLIKSLRIHNFIFELLRLNDDEMLANINIAKSCSGTTKIVKYVRKVWNIYNFVS